MKVSYYVYKFLIVKAKSCKLFYMVNIRDLVDHLVITGTYPVHAFLFFAGTFNTNDNPVSFFPFFYKSGNHLYGILEICAHSHYTVSISLFHSINRRSGLSEILGIKDCFDLFVVGTEPPKQCLGIVFGMVVYKKYLIIVITKVSFHHFNNGFGKRHYVCFFIIGGNDHRNLLFHCFSPAA